MLVSYCYFQFFFVIFVFFVYFPFFLFFFLLFVMSDNKTVSRVCTIHVHKHVHKVQFKKRAPRAVKAIKEFARREMGLADVRLDTSVNKALWSRGIKNPPVRIRVRLTRRRSEDPNARGRLYTLVEYVPVESFKGLVSVNEKN